MPRDRGRRTPTRQRSRPPETRTRPRQKPRTPTTIKPKVPAVMARDISAPQIDLGPSGPFGLGGLQEQIMGGIHGIAQAVGVEPTPITGYTGYRVGDTVAEDPFSVAKGGYRAKQLRSTFSRWRQYGGRTQGALYKPPEFKPPPPSGGGGYYRPTRGRSYGGGGRAVRVSQTRRTSLGLINWRIGL